MFDIVLHCPHGKRNKRIGIERHSEYDQKSKNERDRDKASFMHAGTIVSAAGRVLQSFNTNMEPKNKNHILFSIFKIRSIS
jgi:hypothetical protein